MLKAMDENEFKYDSKDDDNNRNKKDTMKLIFSPDRFLMGKMYASSSDELFNSSEKMVEFVKSAVIGQIP
jgi:hypothetical protein